MVFKYTQKLKKKIILWVTAFVIEGGKWGSKQVWQIKLYTLYIIIIFIFYYTRKIGLLNIVKFSLN